MSKPSHPVDFENVRPAHDRLQSDLRRVIVFTGETPRPVEVDLAFAVPRCGCDIQRIGSGSDARDIHMCVRPDAR